MVEGFVVDENGEEGENVEEMGLKMLIKALSPKAILHTCEMPNNLVVCPKLQ